MHPHEYYVLADLMYGDSDALPRFLESRRKHKSIWTGTGQFIWWGLIEPIRAIAYLFKRATAPVPAEETAPTPEASTVWLHRLAAQAGPRRRNNATEPKQAAASVKSA